MRQAIITKFLGPTTHRGARVKATCDAGSLTLPWDHASDAPANHRAAAYALAYKLGWAGTQTWRAWRGGALPGGRGYAFIRLDY